MKYTDLILKDYPIAVWTLDDDLSGATGNIDCVSYLDNSLGEFSGTYIYNSGMKVSNTGIPLVLGGGNSSYLLDNSGSPSLTIPKSGLMSGTLYGESWSLEFWMRIHNSDDQKHKILGISGSSPNDEFGLYVYKNHLVLNILNSHFIAAPVSSWSVQHHIIITLDNRGFGLIVDGNRFERSNKFISPEYIVPPTSGTFNFYGNNELGYTAIDAIAMYPYVLSETNAKRHIVYGLGFDYAGEIFDNLSGSYTKFSGENSNKIFQAILPSADFQTKPQYRNVISSTYGYQLDNIDSIRYEKPDSSEIDFTFSSSNVLTINKLSKYFVDSFGIAFLFTVDTLDTLNDKILFSTLNTSGVKINVILRNNKIFVRFYPDSLSYTTSNYIEQEIATIVADTEYLFGIGYDSQSRRYSSYVNSTRVYSTNIQKPIFSNDSAAVFGGVTEELDTTEYLNPFNNGVISRITVFTKWSDFISVMSQTSNLTYFSTYYQDLTLEYDKYIRMMKKGTLEILCPLDIFSLDIFSQSLNKKFVGAVEVSHGYPKVNNPEIEVSIKHYGRTSLLATQVMAMQTENILTINNETNIANNFIILSAAFDSTDCLYTPPIIGQFKVTSYGRINQDGSAVDYIASDQVKDVELISNDNKMAIQEKIISAIYLGDDSGVKLFGGQAYIDYSESSFDNDEDRGVKSLSMFVKRNSVDTTKRVIEWQKVLSTSDPTSVQVYKNGTLFSTINLTGKTNLIWSDLSVDLDVWTHIVLIFNTPIVVKIAEFPRIYFGDPSGSSNISIQYLGITEEELTSDQVLSIFKSYSGENLISINDSSTISFVSQSGQTYADNWITVA